MTNIPNPAHPISKDGRIDPIWWRFLNGISLSGVSIEQVKAAVDSAVSAIEPESLTIRTLPPISLSGNRSDGWTIGLSVFDDSGTGALRGITRDAYGRVSGTTDATITGTTGQINVANGDAVAGQPTLSLADVPDSGTGTLQKTAFDAKGRKTGTAAATTDDLGEGAANLYYTDARADARVAAGIATHEAKPDPHPQYTTAAEAAAAAPVQSVNGMTGHVVVSGLSGGEILVADGVSPPSMLSDDPETDFIYQG